jgi:hypothetical protein
MQLDKLTVKAQEALQAASGIADDASSQVIEPEHLLKALLDAAEGIVRPIVQKVGADPDLVEAEVTSAIAAMPKVTGGGVGGPAGIGSRINTVLGDAFKHAEKLKDAYVSTEHLLVAIADDKGEAGRVLTKVGVTSRRLLEALEELRAGARVTDQNPEAQFQALERFSRNLTAAARDGKLDPVIGRTEEIRRVIQVLSRRTKNNPVLVGDAGVGKTAIVEGIAHRIVLGDVPQNLKDKRVIALDDAKPGPQDAGLVLVRRGEHRERALEQRRGFSLGRGDGLGSRHLARLEGGGTELGAAHGFGGAPCGAGGRNLLWGLRLRLAHDFDQLASANVDIATDNNHSMPPRLSTK